ncbi:high affinity cGMP-specific 3',5'-cyclic phosphodiesterase 9A-like [Planoprotostelium fungivorum]|uniref:High affinity cGMP-specific 3',5'-cyclic phosphodiesterase 9A-like n=1 Tax=Planoprotostelium fungivorum TaxID=1890364 RepID=A0A2P6MUQ9_9EUKA|nr:high affinity cGMP-specific 3',5'-cyclic phosphodiesterase 9A-like [Planoprotostelium fungivorum]
MSRTSPTASVAQAFDLYRLSTVAEETAKRLSFSGNNSNGNKRQSFNENDSPAGQYLATHRNSKEDEGTPSELICIVNDRTERSLRRELAEVRAVLETIKQEYQLILRAYQEEVKNASVAQYASSAQIALTPQEKMLEKLLEAPYTSIFKPEVKSAPRVQSIFNLNTNNEPFSLALAPQQSILYKDIVSPNVNLNSLSRAEIVQLSQREYDILPYKEVNDEMHAHLLLSFMFHDLGLVSTFKIPPITLYRFVYVISRRYRNVPFHNFFHAFNVTQTMYFFLRTCHATNCLTQLEVLSLLIATICHDCDHPGLNNDFQKKAHTKIAHLHKKSILENHHYIHCVAVLSKSHTNILVHLTPEQLDQVLITLRDLILATDLSLHGVILKTLGERKKALHKYWKNNDSNMSAEDKKVVMCGLIKCADLSNEIRTQQIGQRWAKLVLEEFFLQSDKEKEMGLPVTAFMDRDKIIVAREQINFIERLCMPLYVLLAQVFPQVESCVRQLEENRNNWKTRASSFFEKEMKSANQSIWERKQTKITGTLTSMLSQRATKGASSQPPRVPNTSKK